MKYPTITRFYTGTKRRTKVGDLARIDLKEPAAVMQVMPPGTRAARDHMMDDTGWLVLNFFEQRTVNNTVWRFRRHHQETHESTEPSHDETPCGMHESTGSSRYGLSRCHAVLHRGQDEDQGQGCGAH